MGNGSRAFLAGGLGFAVAFVVACGGQNGLLDSSQANNLNAQLNSISSAVANGQCGTARTAAQAFSNEVAGLPSSVNTTLVRNLGQGASTVSQLAARDCSSSSSTTRSTSSSASTTTSTPSTASTPSSTSSSTTTTTSTATNPTSSSTGSTTSNGGGAAVGGGNANGNGNGAGSAG
jgi:hypothetical protein